MNEPKYTNHLFGEKSPYLQQHVHNPVDWRPWGEEAFELSRSEDRPIFLSIGYATCHWCHVMERESFCDVEIGKLMNELFVNIKVDREELPDVDGLYMDFAQSMLGGAAGWPLNLVLTPDLRPFYAATYLPSTSQHGLIGMRELVARIREIWYGSERQLVQEQAQEVLDALIGSSQYVGDDLPGEVDLNRAAELLFKVVDPIYGGIRGAPKFPIAYQNVFLLRHFFGSKDARALFCVEKALHMMRRGGIYDQLGGGFSRYSVDSHWLVPHFEKMLYDNALLAEAYTKAWQVTHKEEYRTVAEETLHYVLRDMTHEQGGFFSAEDADSEGKEGQFYTWTPQGVADVLGEEHAFLFCDFYGVTPEGNFEGGQSILHESHSVEEMASMKGVEPSALRQQLDVQRRLLWTEREKRIHPFKDDKILSAWNGLMIHSLAYASAAFGEKRYLDAAEKAAQFLKEQMWEGGQLLRRWRQGEARFDAGLEEYAYVIRGLLTLFEVTGTWGYLDWAVEQAKILRDQFKVEKGAFYQTNGKDTNLIFRKAALVDGAEPSGNAVHAENLLRLFAITRQPEYLEQAEDILRTFKANLEENSISYCYHFIALQRYVNRNAPTLVIALNEEEQYRSELEEQIFSRYVPNRTLLWVKGENPLFPQQVARDNKTTLYLCRLGACEQPLTDLKAMQEAIDGL